MKSRQSAIYCNQMQNQTMALAVDVLWVIYVVYMIRGQNFAFRRKEKRAVLFLLDGSCSSTRMFLRLTKN